MFLGIDGGGTKTAFALVDGGGAVRARHACGGTYHLELGVDAVASRLREGIAATLRHAGVAADDVVHAFVGVPAHGEDSALRPALDAVPRGALPEGRWTCGNDMVCSWAGALACEDGISVIAGTGSIAYGECGGRAARAGGWGELFGDEGSAHWLAREGLALFTRMSDGRAPRGPLHDLVRRAHALDDDLDLCARVLGGDAASRSRFAQAAQLVHAAARAGDTQACALYARAAQELATLVCAVRRRIDPEGARALTVSGTGGVLAAGDLVLAPFQAALAREMPDLRYRPPRLEPVLGAALYAARLAGRPLPHDAVERLASPAPNPPTASDRR